MGPDIESNCRQLVEFQKALVAAWHRVHGIELVATDAPKTGEIIVGDDRWSFRRHGLGIDFIRTSDEIDVDIHDEFARPDLFDLWRLELFLESKGVLIRQPLLADLVSRIPGIEQAGRHYFFRNSKVGPNP